MEIKYGYAGTMPDDSRQEAWTEQKEKYGFDNTELWSLDNSIAKFIAPRIKRFIEVTKPEGEYLQNLEKILEAFELTAKESLPSNEEEIKIAKGLQLFAKHYRGLWY